MQEQEVIKILKKDLNFSESSITKLKLLKQDLIKANKKHNLISKSTESEIWKRHILDSAQLVKFIDFKKGSLADLGSGAGFPGIVIAIFNNNKNFTINLYEKSPVKRIFLEKLTKKLCINVNIFSNVYKQKIEASTIVCRAFKKIDKIIDISREIVKYPHKLIVLKGKNAQEELKKAFKSQKYPYKIEVSMTNKESKIIIMDFN